MHEPRISQQIPSPPVMTASARVYARAYAREIGCELRRYLRTSSFMLPVLLLPLMFYALFGIILNHAPEARRLLLSSYLCFGVMSPGLYGFGVSLAMERDNGLLDLKRIQPAPPGAYLLAKLVMAICVGLIVGITMLAVGAGLAGVSLSPPQLLGCLGLSGGGVIPFASLGMWLATLLHGQAGPGLINLVYLPMAVLSGLWFPLSLLPSWLQQLAPWWPASHLDALAQIAMGLGQHAVWPHLLVLLGYTGLFTGLAVYRLQTRG
ncbi:ABC transporter permease [Frateuria aurantia]